MLVLIDGMRGSGKTQAAAALSEVIQKHGHDVVIIANQRGTDVGRFVREHVVDNDANPSLEVEMVLFASALMDPLDVMIPELIADGKWVIVDRTIYSTAVNQNVLRGNYHRDGLFREIEKAYLDKLIDIPHRMIHLTADIDTLVERTSHRDKHRDIMASRSDENLERASNAYAMYMNEAFTIDTTNISPAQVAEKIYTELQQKRSEHFVTVMVAPHPNDQHDVLTTKCCVPDTSRSAILSAAIRTLKPNCVSLDKEAWNDLSNVIRDCDINDSDWMMFNEGIVAVCVGKTENEVTEKANVCLNSMDDALSDKCYHDPEAEVDIVKLILEMKSSVDALVKTTKNAMVCNIDNTHRTEVKELKIKGTKK